MALPICQRGISAALSVFSWPQSMFCVGVRCLDSSAKNANSSGSPRVYNVPSKRAKFLTKRKSSGFECSGRSHLRFALLVFIRFSPSALCAFHLRHLTNCFDPSSKLLDHSFAFYRSSIIERCSPKSTCSPSLSAQSSSMALSPTGRSQPLPERTVSMVRGKRYFIYNLLFASEPDLIYIRTLVSGSSHPLREMDRLPTPLRLVNDLNEIDLHLTPPVLYSKIQVLFETLRSTLDALVCAAGPRLEATMMLPPSSLVSFFCLSHHKTLPDNVSVAASQAGLPSAAADGSVTMTLHQVNQDGAG